jgi:hypothetical protein
MGASMTFLRRWIVNGTAALPRLERKRKRPQRRVIGRGTSETPPARLLFACQRRCRVTLDMRLSRQGTDSRSDQGTGAPNRRQARLRLSQARPANHTALNSRVRQRDLVGRQTSRDNPRRVRVG